MDINEAKMQIAVLIDSENISSKYASIIFNEIETYGFASYRRIYGNWTKNNGWNQEILLENSITPIQQFDYTAGKNSTDMTMVIDAMDILYSGNVDGFCLVTSDSDFTRLAMRLREANMYVIGMGESKSPVALTKACNKFIHLNLISEASAAVTSGAATADDHDIHDDFTTDRSAKANALTPIAEIEEAIISIVNDNENKDKPTYMGEIGSRLNSKFTDFDVRNYGYTKLLTFIRDKCSKLELIKENTSYTVTVRELDNETDIQKEIKAMITKNGGTIDNLSVIYDQLKKKHPSFDLKDYGYSRISSFLRSIEGVTVKGNEVSLKDKETAKLKSHKK
ncbi:MAG: NYN domain-containing protein [Lachnospiraceae bacterium]|nr:NYN domain-containing protein [Lachnospiraceae bacterium]